LPSCGAVGVRVGAKVCLAVAPVVAPMAPKWCRLADTGIDDRLFLAYTSLIAWRRGRR